MNPSPKKIKWTRNHAGLTRKQAADLIWVTERAWQYYEAGERKMPWAYWWCFQRRAKGRLS